MKKEDIVKEEGEPTSSTPTGASADAGVVKANKGMILRKSVEYIRYLQQLVTAQGARNRELEQELKAYRSGEASISNSSPTSSGPFISALGTTDSSSTLTLNTTAANALANVQSRRRQKATQPNNSIKRNRRAKGASPSGQSGEGDDLDEKDLPLLPDEHDREDHDHDHDESSDPEQYEDDLGENAHFGGMLGGMAGMSGMILADEGMRLDFPGAQHGQATLTSAAGARGRRAVRRTSSTSLGSNANANANANQQQPIHPSHQQHPIHNVQGMNMSMNMNLSMFPDGLGMSVPISVPTGMTDMSMDVDRGHDARIAAIERGRSSTRPETGAGSVMTQKRSFVGNGRHPNGSTVTGMPNGVHLKEEMVDVGVALGLGSTMGMGMGLLPMGMST